MPATYILEMHALYLYKAMCIECTEQRLFLLPRESRKAYDLPYTYISALKKRNSYFQIGATVIYQYKPCVAQKCIFNLLDEYPTHETRIK